MQRLMIFPHETFEYHFEDELEWLGRETREEVLEAEANNNTAEYIRWVQQSLNKIQRAGLVADGINGPKTRAAIRTFQQRRRLPGDGNLNLQTEKALVAAGAGKPPSSSVAKPDAVLDRFDFDKTDLKPYHLTILRQIADRIARSFQGSQPIVTVNLVGHTDPVGSDGYNLNLGTRRGLAVRRELGRLLEQRRKGLSYKVLILVKSKGEREAIAPGNDENSKARNRRVEVFLSTKALLPIKPKPPKPEKPPTPTGRVCNPNELAKGLAACEIQLQQCLKKCETDLNFILGKIKDIPGLAGCFQMGHPLAVTACALSLGGIAAKELIDEYFRRDACRQNCEASIIGCRAAAQANAGCPVT